MQPKLLQMIVSNEFLKQRETEAFLKFNHLDWAFWQPEKTMGGKMSPPPPNIAISSQMTMKLGKDIP